MLVVEAQRMRVASPAMASLGAEEAKMRAERDASMEFASFIISLFWLPTSIAGYDGFLKLPDVTGSVLIGCSWDHNFIGVKKVDLWYIQLFCRIESLGCRTPSVAACCAAAVRQCEEEN